jgi:hypothetical protein
VSRLTVVIPALDSTSALENSLVSALEHRPMGCDVIVVLRKPYADPYDLAGEVRFIDAPRRADAAECIRVGVAAARTDFVFVLMAGCEVTAGWSDMALKHFANPRIAAVVPRLAPASDPTQTVCHGVRLLPGGKRLIHTGPAPLGEELFAGVWAPAISAGFYRLAAIASVDAFSSAMGGPLADARLAVALHSNRWLVAWAPASVVLSDAAALESAASRVSLAWHSQRLALETAAKFGGARSLQGVASVMLGEFFRSLPSPMALVLIAVRLAASMLGPGRAKLAASPTAAGPPAAGQSDAALKGTLEPGIRRVDRSHGRERREQTAQAAKRG